MIWVVLSMRPRVGERTHHPSHPADAPKWDYAIEEYRRFIFLAVVAASSSF